MSQSDLSTNMIIRDEKGRFLPGTEPCGKITTSERGRELAARRVEVAAAKARAKLVQAYMEHTGKPGGRPTDAYGELAGEFARSAYANAMDKPRDAVHAAKLALKLADMLPGDDKATNMSVGVQVNIDAEALATVLARRRVPLE